MNCNKQITNHFITYFYRIIFYGKEKMTTNLISELIDQKKNLANINHWRPIIYDLRKNEDVNNLSRLLQNDNGIIIHDDIIGQVRELIKSKNPSIKYQDSQLDSIVAEYISPTPINEYGLWVYYPWSNRLVHTLYEDDFIFVRTSRNVYKITPEERDILSQKKIGVIGLSVGQSVSLALAMERICGEIRLTDFDILELTNLNRIRTGVHNLGLKKVFAVAREIAEIDPFIKIKCYDKGLSEENMDEFFLGGGKLDLLIEESDGFDIKILSRYKAKELKIPVLMEASDRCMVDVERFDLEPERPILHGLVKHLNVEVLKNLKTTEEKIPYMMDILGIDSCSPRLKASMLEIEQSINTWPQLASAVIMGGGITADVARRLLLNQFKSSGRYYVDVEELIKDGTQVELEISQESTDKVEKIKPFQNLSNEQKIIKKIVEAAASAPSGGNVQPWLWEYSNQCLKLINPFNGEENLLGHGNRSLLLAQGCAIENIDIICKKLNLNPSFKLFPYSETNEIIAEIKFEEKHKCEDIHNLSNFLFVRQTNRYNDTRQFISKETLDFITEDVGKYGSNILIYDNETDLNSISNLLSELEKIRILDRWGNHDFVNEIRWSNKEALIKNDGIELESIHLTEAEKAGLLVSKNSKVIKYLKEWNGGNAFKKLTKKTIDSASCICVVTMPGWDKQHFLESGRIIQNIWIRANSKNVSFQPISAAIFLYFRILLDKHNLNKLDTDTIKKMRDYLPDFQKFFPLNEKEKSVFIFRLNIANHKTKVSIRKPIEEILKFK